MTSIPNATLVVEKGLPDAGPIPMGQGVSIFGKSPTVDVNVDSPYISRQHFQIRCQDDVFFITDLDSTNGTFLNGERLTSQQERRLRDLRHPRLGSSQTQQHRQPVPAQGPDSSR